MIDVLPGLLEVPGESKKLNILLSFHKIQKKMFIKEFYKMFNTYF